MANNWVQAWPIVYDRKLAEAYLTLKGYVPVKRRDSVDPFDYVGIKSTVRGLDHIGGAPGGLTWLTGLGPLWIECGWDVFTDATLHNTFQKWLSKYEPKPRHPYEP